MGVAWFDSEKAERVDHVRLLAPVPIQAQLVLVCLSAVPHAWITTVKAGGVSIQTGRTRLMLTVHIFSLNSPECQYATCNLLYHWHDLICERNGVKATSEFTLSRSHFDGFHFECVVVFGAREAADLQSVREEWLDGEQQL